VCPAESAVPTPHQLQDRHADFGAHKNATLDFLCAWRPKALEHLGRAGELLQKDPLN
jgi:hypothetical protein